ncbi:hypothetical protein CYK37_30200 [Mesorhizobium loti]|nr:hypothetical protein CYK37_30200 [Mesorhizobium loti]
MTKPDTQTMEAVELYQLLTRAAAHASVCTNETLRIVRGWIDDPFFGAADFELEALLQLIDGNRV